MIHDEDDVEHAVTGALILAGGDGTRLRSLTRRIAGDERPKQFCRVLGTETLFEQTRRRVARLVSPERTVAVLLLAHEVFYVPLLTDVPSRCIATQPENRGTGAAILYGLLRLDAMTPMGPVVVSPSDHYVSDDATFMAHVDQAFDVVRARPDLVVLLGIRPHTEDAEYGWIETADRIVGPWTSRLYGVRTFLEKPSPSTAQTLRARGWLWNSFVMVAYPSALLALIKSSLPTVFDAYAEVRSRLNTPLEADALRRLYTGLSSTDFSKQVLATCTAGLAVLAVDGVGWNDLGAPPRVMATLASSGIRPAWARPSEGVA